MTDQRFEQLLHDILDDETPMRAPERLVPETQRAARRVHRQPTWLAMLRARPMRVSRRVVVGSPLQRSLAMGVALLLLALVTVGTVVVGSWLVTGPRTIVVDPGGNGHATTVTAGIALANGGDTVLLRPGEYVEDVVVDKPITLRGDEESGSVIIRYTNASPRVDGNLNVPRRFYLSLAGRLGGGGDLDVRVPRGVLVRADGSVLEDLVIAGPGSGLALRVSADDVTLSGVEIDFDDATIDRTGGRDSMAVLADAGDITIVNSSLQGDLALGGPGGIVLRHNDVAGEIGIRDADAVLEDNTIRAGPLRGSGVTVRGDSDATLVDNDIQVHGRGIVLDGDGVSGTVTENVVTGSEAGLYLQEGAVVTAERNTFVDNDVGIRSRSAGTSWLRDNTVEDNGAGILLSAGSTEVRGNLVTRNRNMGIGVLEDASPVVASNQLCGNGTDLFVAETANPDSSGNVICPITE
jgi:parallel beta-helix repeat protein